MCAAAALIGVLLMAACGESGAQSPPLAETPAADTPPPTSTLAPTPTPSPTPSTPEERVVAAYTTFLGAVAESMVLRDPNYPRLAELAVGDGLLNGKARAMGLLDLGTTAEGRFVPAIQRVEVKGDRAELVDCYRMDFTYREAQTGKVVDEGGTRFKLEAALQRINGAWKVSRFFENEFCVPQDLERQILAAYRAVDRAVRQAEASADPDHPALAAAMAGRQLDGTRRKIAQWRDEGYVRRDFTAIHPVVVQVRRHDTLAIVRDCAVEDPRTGLYDPKAGQRISKEQVEPGHRALSLAQLERFTDQWGQPVWKLTGFEVTEKDSRCDPAVP
ncbi:MAG: hypothetical protein M3O70_27100 [Actinomycetota bacterium]|nr:hypothetical protein [Actinomycetota bacterium]